MSGKELRVSGELPTEIFPTENPLVVNSPTEYSPEENSPVPFLQIIFVEKCFSS